jgi:hypothetical protein
MNHWIPKVLKLLRKHSGKDYPKGGSEMKMENKIGREYNYRK